jgi:hypothetical protein
MADETIEMEAVLTQPVEQPLPEVTTAKQWRQKARARWRVTLPSGATVEARRPDFTALIGQGVIDGDALVRCLAAPDVKSRYELMLPVANSVLPAVVTNPPICATPNGDGSISVEEIPASDRMAIFLWAGGWNTTPVPAVAIPDSE